jgi:hypothetical protein
VRDGHSDIGDGGECGANTSRLRSYMYARISATPSSSGLPPDFTVTRQVSLPPGRSLSRKVANDTSSCLLLHGTYTDDCEASS